MTERLARFWLSLGDLPSSMLSKILESYQTAQAFYEARETAGPLLGAAWKRLQPWQDHSELEKKLERLKELGIAFITPEDEVWPYVLDYLEDPPIGLYCMGDLSLLRHPQIFAMVGTRHSTVYGQRMARVISRDLTYAGTAILSGFAVGIDCAAHEGCLEAGGKTIAMLGCGLDVDYPSGSGTLKRRIIDSGGLLVTEHPMKSRPVAGHFPQRNRMLAALCKGLMLLEGTTRSGGMISAHLAMERGNEVFALPGTVESAQSAGPHQLIREGARLAASAADILTDMGWQQLKRTEPKALDGPVAQLYALIEQEPLSFDQLTQLTGWTADVLNSYLTMMEIDGLITKSPGRVYSKAL